MGDFTLTPRAACVEAMIAKRLISARGLSQNCWYSRRQCARDAQCSKEQVRACATIGPARTYVRAPPSQPKRFGKKRKAPRSRTEGTGGLDLEAPGVLMLRTIAGPCVGIPADLRGPSGTRASLRDPRTAMDPASSGSGEGHAAPPRRLSRRGSIVAATAHGCAAAQGVGRKASRQRGLSAHRAKARAPAAEECLVWVRSMPLRQVAACRNVYQNQHKMGISVTEALR